VDLDASPLAPSAFEVLCDPAITAIGTEMRELLFYGHCRRNDIFRFRHLHKIAAEFEHQRSFDIAAVNPVNHLDRMLEVVWKRGVPAQSSPLPGKAHASQAGAFAPSRGIACAASGMFSFRRTGPCSMSTSINR
jgi:hypothetical protein